LKPFQPAAGRLVHGPRERLIDPSLELEAVDPDLYRDQIAAIDPLEPRSWRWQPGIQRLWQLLRNLQESLRILRLLPRSPNAEVGVVGDLKGAAARAFGKATLGEGLDAPGDPAIQDLLVVGPGLLSEDQGILLADLGHGHAA
jgi:hypothetical protein